MHNLQQHLAEMIGQRPRRRALDRIPVPAPAIRRLYELVDELGAKQEAGKGVILASRALWAFVDQTLPFTRGKDVAINTSDIMRPTIDVYGNLAIPQVGKKGVIAAFEMPEQHLYRFFELVETHESSVTAKYDLWSFIGSIFNLPHEDENGRRVTNQIVLTPPWVGIISKIDEDGDE